MAAPIEVLISTESSGQLWSSCVWDIETGTSLASFKGSSVGSHGICLIRKDYLITSVANKPLLQMCALQRRDQQQMKVVCPGRVSSLTSTPDGHYCIAGIENKIYIWQVCTGHLLTILSRHYQKVTCLAITDDGSHFVSGGDDALIAVWSLSKALCNASNQHKKTETECVWTSHSLPITDLHVGCGGPRARIVSSSQDQTCRLFDMATKQLLCTFLFDVGISSVTMDTAEYRLFAGGSNGKIYTVNLYEKPVKTERHIPDSKNDDQSSNSYTGHSKKVSCLCLSMDGTRLLSGSQDGTVKVWDIFSRQCIRTISHKEGVTNICLLHAPPSLMNPDSSVSCPIQTFQRQVRTVLQPHQLREGEEGRCEVPVRIQGEAQELRCEVDDECKQILLSHKPEMLDSVGFDEQLTALQKKNTDLQQANKQIYNFAVNKLLQSGIK